MTVDEMRAELDLGPEIPDIDIVDAWVEHEQGLPTTPLITLAEAKKHLRVTSSDEDDSIQGMLDAALGVLDGPQGWLGRSLTKVTRVERVLLAAAGLLRLPYPPIVDVITVEDRSGAPWSVLEELAWTFDDGLLELAAGGRCGAPYRVVYTAGYTELPKPLRAAVLMMLADMYENRAGDELMSPAVKAMTRPFVVYY